MFTDGTVDSNRVLYTPSLFAKAYLIHLQEIGSLTATKPHTSARSKLVSYLFFTILDGKGTLMYQGKKFALQTGDCVFIDCKESYSHATEQNNLWKLQWVHFYGNTMPGIYDKYKERGGLPVFHPDKLIPYLDILDSIFNTATSDHYLRDMIINEQLAALLTKVMEMSWQPENQVTMRRGAGREYTLQDIKDYLDKNWAKRIVLDELADLFFINKYYLTRLFRNQYGITIFNYLTNLRITKAKQQLRFTDQTVEKIGMECGYEDANYFSRSFKKIEGCSPNEYRKRWQQ